MGNTGAVHAVAVSHKRVCVFFLRRPGEGPGRPILLCCFFLRRPGEGPGRPILLWCFPPEAGRGSRTPNSEGVVAPCKNVVHACPSGSLLSRGWLDSGRLKILVAMRTTSFPITERFAAGAAFCNSFNFETASQLGAAQSMGKRRDWNAVAPRCFLSHRAAFDV